MTKVREFRHPLNTAAKFTPSEPEAEWKRGSKDREKSDILSRFISFGHSRTDGDSRKLDTDFVRKLGDKIFVRDGDRLSYKRKRQLLQYTKGLVFGSGTNKSEVTPIGVSHSDSVQPNTKSSTVVATYIGKVTHIESGSASVSLHDEVSGDEIDALIDASKLLDAGIVRGHEFKMFVSAENDSAKCIFEPLHRKAVSKEKIQRILQDMRAKT